jgi:Domain of unknown function (DUF927)
MEGVAALFNDNLLAFDEISQCSPHDVGKIVYSLANGVGKQRTSRTGARVVSRSGPAPSYQVVSARSQLSLRALASNRRLAS